MKRTEEQETGRLEKIQYKQRTKRGTEEILQKKRVLDFIEKSDAHMRTPRLRAAMCMYLEERNKKLDSEHRVTNVLLSRHSSLQDKEVIDKVSHLQASI